ncbi:hypothetical protein DBR06_SOUSAS5410087, partial [Sousa chinensis]
QSVEEGEQAAAGKAAPKEDCQSRWAAPGPKFTATQPEVTDWCVGAGVPRV